VPELLLVMFSVFLNVSTPGGSEAQRLIDFLDFTLPSHD
jgi:hypothetical protein